MKSLLASLVFLVSSPAVQRGGSYVLLPWSPGNGISGSISSPNSVVRSNGNFFVLVTMGDTDIYKRSDTMAEVEKGGAQALSLSADPNNGKIDEYGNESGLAFYQDGQITFPSVSDSSITAKISYTPETLAPGAYPLTRKLKYTISDTAAYPDPTGPGFVKDLTPITVSTTIQITLS